MPLQRRCKSSLDMLFPRELLHSDGRSPFGCQHLESGTEGASLFACRPTGNPHQSRAARIHAQVFTDTFGTMTQSPNDRTRTLSSLIPLLRWHHVSP